MASNNPVALCHPLPYGRCAAPSKKDSGSLEGKANDYAAPAQGQRRDDGPAGPVTSGAIGPVRPSAVPHTIPTTASPSLMLWERAVTGRRHTGCCASYGLTSMAPSSPHNRWLPNRRPLRHHPRSRSWTHTGRTMTPCQKKDSPGQPSAPWHCVPRLYT
jgi:hypothetical protein